MAEESVAGTSVSGGNGAENEENVISMVDVLQENQQLEAEATAVLGDSDDKFCTYPQGYLSRQALYACGTCSSKPNPAAGICLACSYECHEGHELFELYTKRNFRCDCGNSKFPNLTCKLEKIKAPTNPDNNYNDNFHGVYCICKRPYPDPEDETEDEMIQCVMCEEWYHGRHLGTKGVPDNEDYQEMVCCACMKRCEFLWAYTVHSLETKIVKEETTDSVDVEGSADKPGADGDAESKQPPAPSTDAKESEDLANSATTESSSTVNNTETNSEVTNSDATTKNPATAQSSTTDEEKPNESSKTDEEKPNKSEDEKPIPVPPQLKTDNENVPKTELNKEILPSTNGQPKTSKDGEDGDLQSNAVTSCKLKELQARGVYRGEHATFWPTGWRDKLCACNECKNMYREKSVAFLTDASDSVLAYEQRGLSRQRHNSSSYDQGMEALSTMDRTQQVEMLHGFNDLKSELTDYLKEFADQGKVVKREDIDKFFEDMQAKKRQRIGGSGTVQYLCR